MKISQRFKEPSTWAGLAGLGVVFGLPAEAVPAVAQIGAGVGFLLSIFLPEKQK